jgi:arabinogalactan endo-1,4-beta-galactosidase
MVSRGVRVRVDALSGAIPRQHQADTKSAGGVASRARTQDLKVIIAYHYENQVFYDYFPSQCSQLL